MLVRSPSPTSADPSAPASLAIGALSPVSAASCASSVADRTIRPSAGTMSPASTWTMSPGTTSVAGTSVTDLSRSTRACGTCSLASASTLALAVSSCRVPSVRFSRISRATMIPVDTSPISRLTTTTATSMMFIGSRSWSRAILQADGGFSAAISLAPNLVSRSAASPAVRPAATSEPAAATTSSAASAHGGVPVPACSSPTSVIDHAPVLRSTGSAVIVVPASPCSMATVSSIEPIAASLPVCSTNEQAARTFGPIDPSANSAASQL